MEKSWAASWKEVYVDSNPRVAKAECGCYETVDWKEDLLLFQAETDVSRPRQDVNY